VLKSGRPLGWTSLGSEPLNAALNAAPESWHELSCEEVQPICWSMPESFVRRGDDDVHAQAFDARAWCYMLSNTEIRKRKLDEQLIDENTFFSYLVRRSLGARAASHQPNYEALFTTMVEQYRSFGDESVSGPGSTLEQTKTLRERLPLLIESLDIRSLLDAPCGDFNWMQHVALGVERYIGVDILGEVIATNCWRYGNRHREFHRLNITADALPAVDAILSRDFLVHLSFEEIAHCLRRFMDTGARYLMTTTFPALQANEDTLDCRWRALNLCLPPFGFLRPLSLIQENCTENGGRYCDKALGVWSMQDVLVCPLRSGPS
jgi:hypothetical protein